MKRWRIEYLPEFPYTPISYWVHKQLGDDAWTRSKEFDPPLPPAIPGKGFPYLIVDAFGVDLVFASPLEVEHVLEVFSQKNMPSSLQLSRKRGSGYGPNNHWLSRLPATLKPWSKRQKLIPLLERALDDLRAVYK